MTVTRCEHRWCPRFRVPLGRWCARHDRQYVIACALRDYYHGGPTPAWVLTKIATSVAVARRLAPKTQKHGDALPDWYERHEAMRQELRDARPDLSEEAIAEIVPIPTAGVVGSL